MKNRHIYRIMMGLVALLLVTTACVEPVMKPQPENGELYPISFRVQTQDDGLQTKGGPLSGEDALVNSLFMYCFDSNGRYLGRYQATILTQEPYDPTADPAQLYTETQTPGTFEGEIPPATARIHFVANADCPVGGDMIGMTEKQVMHTPGQVYRTKDSPMSYWGYLRRDTPSQLAALFDGTHTETVWMVRDRAIIEAGNYNKTTVFYDDISWVVYNGLNNGYIATYGTTPADDSHDEPWLDADNPYQELEHIAGTNFYLSAYVTPYSETGGRFTTTEADMVPFDKTKAGYEPMYVFDDECPNYAPARVTKIIIKATFRVTGNSTTDHAEHTKYFPLCVTHGFDAEAIPIHRGHRYQLSLQKLPEAAGYDDFAGAAAATTFVNGSLVDIPESVIEVSDESFKMRVNYEMTYPLSGETFLSTGVLVQNTASNVVVPFFVGKQNPGVVNKDFDFSESAWIPDDEATPAHSGNVTWGAGISGQHATVGADLNSSITIPLQPVSSSLKKSVYNLKGFYKTVQYVDDVPYDVKHILMRNVEVYSIDRFLIQEAYTSSAENHNEAGNLVLVSRGSGTYRLKFKLPGGTTAAGDHDKYPEILYPIQVKLATRTLRPTGITINGVEEESPVFGVQVRSTVPDTEPAMLPAQNDPTQWNYQEANNYWNFWYTYSIVSVPRSGGNEVVGPEIWIDLDDVRDPNVFQPVPNNVGLYLYIEFFGAANAVSIET